MALKVPSPDASSEPVMQPAAKLTVGDRIAAGFLPERDAAEIGFVHRYLRADEPWVFVAYTFADRSANSSYFRADALIPLEGVADFTGLTYTRADSDADDPTPVSPARVPPHTGSVVADGVLVTDTGASAACPKCDQLIPAEHLPEHLRVGHTDGAWD